MNEVRHLFPGEKLTLKVEADNKPAIAFYKKYGFIQLPEKAKSSIYTMILE
jgi:ribosomal protein S18 acetylase RimI-like enzyme